MQYAVMLSEVGSFSQLAEKLNISQPALSKQILSLEKELGVVLFDRNVTPIALTGAGEYFVREAKELLYKEDNLQKSMEQFKSGEKGTLTIGITPFRSAYLIPRIVKKIREKFPNVKIKLVEEGSEVLRKDATDGKFDFAIVNLPVDEAVLDVTLIEPDKLALVVPREIIEKCPKPMGKTKVDFADLGELPFVAVGANQEMRVLFEKLCAKTGVRPEIVTEVVGLTTAWEMALTGVGATLLPLQFLSDYAKYAINLLTNGK